MGLRGDEQDHGRQYVSSDLSIMMISGQNGGYNSVFAQENLVFEVTLFLAARYLYDPSCPKIKGGSCEIGRSITHKFTSLERFVERQFFLSYLKKKSLCQKQ
jgi:hypothetical protein